MLNSVKQTWNKYKTDMKKILFMMLCIFCLMACGTTKVAVSRPQNGTYTQITVTTNNPITTDVKPDTNLDLYGNH